MTRDKELFHKWAIGKHIYVWKRIFNKMKKPKPTEMATFLDVLNQVSHANIYSQQPTVDWSGNKADVLLNFVFILVILEMNQHLLTKHIINKSHIYCAKTYAPWNTLGLLRKIHYLSSESKKLRLSKKTKKLIYEFNRKWYFE